mgnify:CR=1 FL=1
MNKGAFILKYEQFMHENVTFGKFFLFNRYVKNKLKCYILMRCSYIGF